MMMSEQGSISDPVRVRTRSSCHRDSSPLGAITSNQLYLLLGECNGKTEATAAANRKPSVESVSGLRRSRTFTATDGARRSRPMVPVLRSRDLASHRAVATAASCKTARAQPAAVGPADNKRRHLSPSSSAERTICQPACLQVSSFSRTLPASAAPGSSAHVGLAGVRTAVAKTRGRTPPRLGRSLSFVSRRKKASPSSSLRRMSSLRKAPSDMDVASGSSTAPHAPQQFVPKIAIVGAERTGKSAIVTRWLRGSAPESTFYEPTIEDRFQHVTTINGHEHSVEVIDTSGADDFGEMREQAIRSAHAIILVYDVTQPTSLIWLKRLFQEVMNNADQDRPRPLLLLVGNKVDCQDQRCVSNLDGAALARELFRCEYLESSARSGINVDEVFQRVVKTLGKKASALLKPSASVSRSRSFLARTVGAIRPKRRPKIPTQWDSGSGDVATLRPTQRGKVRMKMPSPAPSDSNL